MHRHQHFRPLVDECGHLLRVDVEVGRRDVGEARRRTGGDDRVERGDEGERAGDHLVTGLQPEGLYGGDQRRRAVVDSDDVLGADQCGELVLQTLDHRTLGDDPGTDHLQDRLLDLRAEADDGHGDLRRGHEHRSLPTFGPGGSVGSSAVHLVECKGLR
jgi:hypothetical protein